MSNITLVMTRMPLQEVNFGKKNGRWGKMIVVKGSKILSGSFTSEPGLPVNLPGMPEWIAKSGAIGATYDVINKVLGRTVLRLGNKNVSLQTAGGDVEVVDEFDTLERFRTDDNKSKYYVQLKPRPSLPYDLRLDTSKTVQETLPSTGGKCFRVLNHDTKNGNGGKAGILIHEAPHMGYLIGCIGPREVNNRTPGYNAAPSKRAMESLFKLISSGKNAQLLVMDW